MVHHERLTPDLRELITVRMNADELHRLAEAFVNGQLTPGGFAAHFQSLVTQTLPEAAVDLDRRRRCGYAEVVFAQGKTAPAVCGIARQLLDAGHPVLVTRVDDQHVQAMLEAFPEARHNRVARTVCIGAEPTREDAGKVLVISAGTSDQPVAEEAVETLKWMGVEVELLSDVGVAGPHRLAAHHEALQAADAIVVAAGMEGALPSVVGGHVAVPVFAVPTSVGYGASFHGLAALLGMLNSCAANVAVVNIDAGFKAGYLAGLVARPERTDS